MNTDNKDKEMIQKLIEYFEQQKKLQDDPMFIVSGREAYDDAIEVCKNILNNTTPTPRVEAVENEPKGWTALFHDEKNYLDFLRWQREQSKPAEKKEDVYRWVKANERLPDETVPAKYGFHYGELVEHHGYFSFDAKGTHVTVKYNDPALKNIEWLEKITR